MDFGEAHHDIPVAVTSLTMLETSEDLGNEILAATAMTDPHKLAAFILSRPSRTT
jgi:hypothetical protein